MKSVGEVGEGPLAGAFVAADAAYVWNLSPAEQLRKQIYEGGVELTNTAVFNARRGFGREAIRADTGSRIYGAASDWVPLYGRQAALLRPENVLDRVMVFLCRGASE